MDFLKTNILTLVLIIISQFSFSQKNKNTSIQFLNKNYLTENNEGYIKPIDNKKVLFWVNQNGLLIYFHSNSISFKRKKRSKKKDKIERKESRVEYSESWSLNFGNGNSSSILPSKELSHYYCTYQVQENAEKPKTIKSKNYKQITYKNIWKNIDIKFYFLDNEMGLKYDVILNPGANHEDFNFNYINATIKSDEEGGLLIKTPLGLFTDQAPKTINQNTNKKIKCEFEISDSNTVSLMIEDYDASHTIVVDPWIVSPITYGNWVTEIDYDLQGNVYAILTNGDFDSTWVPFLPPTFSSTAGIEIVKYNSAGVLQWTLFIPNYIAGDITVSKTTGEIYVSNQVVDNFVSFESVSQIDNSGAVMNVYSYNPAFENNEFWRLKYDDCNDELIVGGGGVELSAPTNVGILNSTLTTYTTLNICGLNIATQDVCTMALDPDGSSVYFFVGGSSFTSISACNQNIFKVPLGSGLTPNTWNVSTDYTFDELSYNNGMACGNTYLYVYDGDSLTQWNKATGAFVNSINPGGVYLVNGGLDIETCTGNIFVGVGNIIKVYDNSLNFLTSYNLPDICLDIALNQEGKLFVSGRNFISQIDLPLNLNLSFTPNTCASCDGTATINGCISNTASILWEPSGETSVIATGLCEGWNIVTVTDTGTCNNRYNFTYKDSVFISSVVPCAFTIDIQDSTICQGDCINLIATSSENTDLITFVWDNGITSNNDTVNVCPTTTTTYNVTATNLDGDVSTATATITVVSPPIINLGNDITLCGGSLVLDAQNAGANYLWQDGSTNQTLTVTTSGTYNVEVNNGGCISTDEIIVTINGPIVDLGSDITSCNPNLVLDAGNVGSTYLWQDGSTNQTFTVLDTGTYYVDVTDASGCTVSDTIIVSPDAISVDLGADAILCSGNTILLGADNTGSTYLWQDGSTAQTHLVNQAGTYYVDVTNGVCTASDTIEILVQDPLALFSVSDTVGCEPLNVNFLDLSNTSTPIISWNWTFGDGNTSTLQNPTHIYANSGIYNVELVITTVSGCSSNMDKSVTIEIFSQPQAVFSFSPISPEIGTEVQFEDQSINASTWEWDFGNNTTSTLQNPTSIYSSNNNFNITLVVTNGSCVDSTSKTIIIEEEIVFYIPNVFTPDGDAYNNVFQPVFTSGYDPYDYHLLIFNRWGEVIFESRNATIGWNGFYNEKLAQDGVYVWKIRFGDINNDKKYEYIGHVTLLR